MAVSKKRDESNCFAGILRRLLCTGSHPTHPSSDQNPDQTPKHDICIDPLLEKTDGIIYTSGGGSTPPGGIVARLMGLDSMPIENYLGSWELEKKAAGSSLLGRSRSMNSLEYIMRFETIRANRASSFRELPTFSKKFEQKTVSLEKTEQKQRKMKDSFPKYKKDLPLRTKGRNNLDRLPPQIRDPKKTEKMTPKNRASRGNLREKNPTIYCNHVSINPKSNNQKKKMVYRPNERIQANKKVERFPTVSVVDKPDNKPRKRKAASSPRVEKSESLNHLQLSSILPVLSEVCKLADEEVISTNPVAENGFVIISGFGEYCDEVCTEFGNQILEYLVCQTLDELLMISNEKSAYNLRMKTVNQ